MPDDAASILREAESAEKARRYAESAVLYRRYIDLRPNDASGWAKIGYIMIFLHDHEAAAAALEEALRLKPDYADARLRYALALELRGDAERAISEYRSGIAMADPIAKDPFWAARFAQLLLDRGETREAEQAAREALKTAPDDIQLQQLLACLLDKRRRWREAIQVLRAILARETDDHWTLYALGRAYFGSRNWRGARECYEKASKLRPDSATAFDALASVLWQVGELDAAAAAFRRAISLSPKDPYARLRLAELLGQRYRKSHLASHLQAARSELAEAMALAPDADAVLVTRANIEWYAGNRERSIQLLEQGAKRRPDLLEYHARIMWRSLRMGRFRRAWSAARQLFRSAEWPWDRNAVWNELPRPPSPGPGAESPPAREPGLGLSDGGPVAPNHDSPT